VLRPPSRLLPTTALASLVALAALAGCQRATELPPLASAPLAARTPRGDGPRFRLLDPTQTGVAFGDELRRENAYTYLTNGTGLATGDYDGDGDLDLYLVSQDGPNRLFRQDAPLRFTDVTVAAGGVDGGDAWGTAVLASSDLDGDGDLDLLRLQPRSRRTCCYENQGDGTFRRERRQVRSRRRCRVDAWAARSPTTTAMARSTATC
jgi:hypothetical protein